MSTEVGGAQPRGPAMAEVDSAHNAWWFRLGRSISFREGFEAGREQVLTAITDGQDDTRRRLSGLAREPDFAELERIRREPARTTYCVTPDCRSVETVPMDTDMTTVRCLKHRGTGEPRYLRDPGYRPYTGGAVPEW